MHINNVPLAAVFSLEIFFGITLQNMHIFIPMRNTYYAEIIKLNIIFTIPSETFLLNFTSYGFAFRPVSIIHFNQLISLQNSINATHVLPHICCIRHPMQHRVNNRSQLYQGSS